MHTFILSACTWLIVVVGVVVGFCVMLPIYAVSYPFDPTRKVTGTVFRRIARWMAKISPLLHFSAQGPYPPHLAGPHVVVSNHESHLDAFLISFLPYEMKWLAKESLFRLPFIGWCMALAGDIKVVRGSGSSVQGAMGQCKKLLSQGMSVFLFPEGTRSAHEAMLPFKEGAFRLALEARVPILPLAVAGTSQGLRKNSMSFYPSRAVVRVGEAVSVLPWLEKITDPQDPMTLSDATSELKEAVRMQIGQMRAELRQEMQLTDEPPSLYNGPHV